MDGDKLTPRQKRFVAEYLVDANGAQAAIRAGYSAKGADVQACKLLVVPKVAAAIAAKAKALDVETTNLAAKVVNSLMGIAFAEKDPDERVRVADQLKALELLGRYEKLFTDKIEHAGQMPVSINLILRGGQ